MAMPVQTMISSRSGLIRWTVLRETISREVLPRLFFEVTFAAPGMDLAVGLRPEPLDHVAVVIETADRTCE